MEEIAEFESKSTFPWEGKDIHYTQIPVVLANVSESLRRRRLNEIRARALEQSNPLRKGRLDRLRAQVQALGYKTCLEAYQSIWGIDYRAFSSSLEKLIEATEARYKDCVEESFQRILGLPPAQVHRSGSVQNLRLATTTAARATFGRAIMTARSATSTRPSG